MRLHSGLFLGVSLSAAARSAAALVYDKLTPNCHSKILYGKRQSLLKCCLYVCMKFCGMSNSAVQGIVSLAYACFPTVDFASADAEFGADFCLPHAVHITIQDGEFQSG